MDDTEIKAFIKFLRGLLIRGMPDEYADNILSKPEYIKLYIQTFTGADINEQFNYEVMEHFGDAVLKYITVNYIHARWPFLSVKARSSLSQVMYGKKQLAFIATNLNFGQFIKTNTKVIVKSDGKKNPGINQLEDVFEAFLGTTQSIVDSIYGFGAGGRSLYIFMSGIWNKQEFDTSDEGLRDPVTKLKEQIWDPLGWKKSAIGENGFALMKTNVRLVYNNHLPQKWRVLSSDFTNDDESFRKGDRLYHIRIATDPEGIVIAWAGSVNSSLVNPEASKIAYDVFDNLGVAEMLKKAKETNDDKKLGSTRVANTSLPKAYQVFIDNRKKSGMIVPEWSNRGLLALLSQYTKSNDSEPGNFNSRMEMGK